MKYIVVDDSAGCGTGDSLEQAFDDYRHCVGLAVNEDLDVYECSPIEVEFKIMKKVTPVKVESKAS